MLTQSSSLRRRGLLAGVLLHPLVVFAQTTSTPAEDVDPRATPARTPATPARSEVEPTSNDTSGEPDDLVVLSPFVVEAERDTGYRATSTLAGSRLNTPLSDVGASVSVVTKDMIEDLGMTSINDVLVYTGGTETSGINGNFSGAVDYGNTQTIGFGDRSAPQDANRTRGLGGPTRTRNYFIGPMPMDAYNIESVTVVRGPNSVLFGAGSPAGVVETSLIKANVSESKTKLEFRYGDNNSRRAVVDHNQVIVPGKLAVRLALLGDRQRYDQRPAFEDKERAFGAITYRPFDKTWIRLNAEMGQHHANRPIATLPFNSIPEAWFADGRPFADWRYYDDPALNPNARFESGSSRGPDGRPLPYNYGDFTGQFQAFRQTILAYTTPDATLPAFAFNGRTERGAGSVPYPAEFNRDNQNDNIYWVSTGNVGEVSNNAAFARTGIPEFAGGRPVGLVYQGYTDYSAFDFRNRMIDETARFDDRMKSFNVALDQQLWGNRLGFQIEYDWQNYERWNRAVYFSGDNQNHIRLDTTRWLPQGGLNPNFGRPFVQGGTNPAFNRAIFDVETIRATAFARYDFDELKEGLGSWLGRHTLTGLFENFTSEQVRYQKAFFGFGEPAIYTTTATALNGFSRRPVFVTYLGPSVYDTGSISLSPIRSTAPKNLQVVPVSYYNWNTGQVLTANETLVETLHGGNMSVEEIETKAGVLQSYWLDDHLVTLFGIRKDDPSFGSRSLNLSTDPNASLEAQAWQALRKSDYNLDDIDFATAPRMGATTRTYSAVLKWPERVLALPEGTSMSFFYNNSENFSPSGATRDTFLNILPSPKGETEEFGFTIGLFEDKFYLRVNRYETASVNVTRSSDVMLAALNQGLLQRASIWLADTLQDRIADVNILRSVYSSDPDIWTQSNFRIITNAQGQRSGTYDNISQNRGDTVDVAAEGYEFELTYNPTSNWRISLNAAKQEAVQSNMFPRTREVIETISPVWAQLASKPAENYQAGDNPATNTFVGESLGSFINRTVLVPYAQAVALEGSQSPELREWRANAITNYTFSRNSPLLPMLKGVNIGTGIRWQSKAAVGFPVSLVNGVTTFDIENPHYAPEEFNVDAWIGYRFKIGERLNWRIQLNVTNITTNDDPIMVRAQPWGDAAIVRIPPERRWYITNTITF